MSINVEYNSKEVNNIVIENILRMLQRRLVIESWSDEFKKLDNIATNTIFELTVSDKSKYSIYLVKYRLFLQIFHHAKVILFLITLF